MPLCPLDLRPVGGGRGNLQGAYTQHEFGGNTGERRADNIEEEREEGPGMLLYKKRNSRRR